MKKIFISISILVITGILGMLMYNNITSEKTYYTETKFGKISELVKKNDRIILFVEQDGCSSCKLVKPIINNNAKENKGIVYSVTANKEKDYNVQSEKYHIEGTPTLIYFKEGKEVYRTNTGFTEDEFQNTIKKVEF